LVADEADAKAAFLKPAMGLGMTVVSRLLKNPSLWTVPEPRPKGRRGRPWISGEHRIDLAKRAGQHRGWATGVFELDGESTVKRYKMFLGGGTQSVV
jgi:hypothetical protein